jgi:RimJ/RimL family protein N-acetyltransferase
VCSDQFEGQLYGGLGAQVDFVRGAALSKGGKPVVCLTSTTEDGETSRIKALLDPGEAATLARSDLHYVVTEYGIAYLHGKSIKERALSLIAIAHPKFREELLARSKELGFLDASCTIESAFPYPVEEEVLVTLRSGKVVKIRPAIVSDARGIKSLFYGLPADDRYTRFFRQVRALSSQQVQKLCNLDYKLSVAFVAVQGERENETVIGHATYFVNPSTNLAETAFMVSNHWQGSGLGGAMQRRLMDHAKGRGIRGFEADILPENSKMIRLARSCCDNVTVQRDEESVHITMHF